MTEKSMFEQNLEMWEKFVNRNMDLMFTAMEKTMEGSKTFQEQVSKAVDRAVEESRTAQERMASAAEKTMEGSESLQQQVTKAVNTAVSAQLEATLLTLKALERQVETLSNKVDELVEKQDEE